MRIKMYIVCAVHFSEHSTAAVSITVTVLTTRRELEVLATFFTLPSSKFSFIRLLNL